MSRVRKTKMQPAALPSFISKRNRRIWAGKRQGLAQHEEVLRNIALQAGVSPLPWSAFTSIIRLYTGCVGIGGMLGGAFTLGLAIWWATAARDSSFWDNHSLSQVGFAIILSLLLLSSFSYALSSRDLIVYPPCVLQLYRQLVTSGEVTTCDIHDVRILDNSTYLLHYRFTIPGSGMSINAQYVTNRLFPAGSKMAVIYLDATCCVLL